LVVKFGQHRQLPILQDREVPGHSRLRIHQRLASRRNGIRALDGVEII